MSHGPSAGHLPYTAKSKAKSLIGLLCLGHAIACALSVWPQPGYAQTPYRTEVHSTVKSPTRSPLLPSDLNHTSPAAKAQRRLDRATPGFAIAIAAPHTQGARPSDGASEAIAQAAGASIRSLGGLGQFSALSLRGSTSQQTAVFYDGIPLAASTGGLMDLSDLPLEFAQEFEIFLGFAPIHLAGAPMGGALNVVSFDRAKWNKHRRIQAGASIGGGSFGGQEVDAHTRITLAQSPKHDQHRFTVHASAAQARGDFSYLDVQGTPAIPSRHIFSLRQNNGFARISGRFAHRWRYRSWRLDAQHSLKSKKQEIAGSVGNPTQSAQLKGLSWQTTAHLQRKIRSLRGGKWHLRMGIGVRRRRFEDPQNEVGLARDDETTDSLDIYLAPALGAATWPGARAEVQLALRHEWSQTLDRTPVFLDGSQTKPIRAIRSRLSAGLSAQIVQSFWQGRIAVVPALQIDTLQSRFATPSTNNTLTEQGENTTTAYASPRIGTKIKTLPGLVARATVGRYLRAPNLLELFGDRGFIVGSPSLLPERGTTADVGMSWDLGQALTEGLQKPPSFLSDLYLQASAFAGWAKNRIQWQQAGPTLRPQNLDASHVLGMQSQIRASLWQGLATVQGSYSFIRSRNKSISKHLNGQSLPGRPEHTIFARIEIGPRIPLRCFQAKSEFVPRLAYTFDHVAGNFLDASGWRRVPARTLHGAALLMTWAPWLRFAAEVRNIANSRITFWTPPTANPITLRVPLSDFIGYPLPGRSLWLKLQFLWGYPT